MSVSIWQQPAEYRNLQEFEVVVIGAGIMGAYTANTLAKSRRKVAVLESRFPAAGATGRNAGFCMMGATDNYATGVKRYGRDKARQLWFMTRENQRKTLEFIEIFGTFSIRCGAAITAIDTTESELLTQAYQLMREDGLDVSFSPTDPFERGFGAAILQPDDFGLDPVGLVNALLDDAAKQGAKLFCPAEVYAISQTNDGKLLVEARGLQVVCEQVALCTNAYSPLISSYFNDKVAPRRGQILMTAPVGHKVMDRLAYSNYGYEYFRQLPNGSFLLGGGRGQHPELEVGYDEVPTAWVQATLEEFLQKHFPDVVKAAPIVRRWAGIMGFAVDGLPLVGRLPEVPGQFQPIQQPIVPAPTFQVATTPPVTQTEIYYAVGLTGHGMGWGLITADAMLEQMLGHKSDGGLFDVKRLYV